MLRSVRSRANNAANVTAVHHAAGLLSLKEATALGGLSIAMGAMTYSRPALLTMRRSLVKPDGFSALVIVLAEAATIHLFAGIGVPVSTSHAVFGAALGVGLGKQVSAVHRGMIIPVLLGWVLTPIVAATLSMLLKVSCAATFG